MLTAPAPAGGLVVNLQSSNPLVQVAGTVTVPGGQTSANFNIQTSAGTAIPSATITASLGGCAGASAAFAVNLPLPTLQNLALSAASVKGGLGVTGTVTLNGPAPAGGATVSLSSNSLVATVPATVTIPAGQSSANFSLTTSPLAVLTNVTVTA